MRIVCPACETAYDVPDTVLAPGRTLRCARCRSEWVPVAMPAEEAVAAPEPGALPDQQAAPADRVPPSIVRVASSSDTDRPAGPRVTVIAGWLVSLLLLGGMGYAAVVWRQPIAHAWPPAGRAYAWLGYS
jgi:predicted Zn finger-like uncharacterized protein